MQEKNDFSIGPVWQVIMRMALPMMIAELVNILYSVVDRMYIGHIPVIGDLALSGLGICIPITTIVTAFASMCGTGGGPLCSIARGELDIDKAETIQCNTFVLLLALGVFLTFILSVFLRPLLFLFGASDVTFPYAYSYARIYVLGTVFAMLSFGMNYFINSQGFAKIGMLTIAIGAVINIVLDYILIFILNMGIAGAAIATVIAQFISALWVMLFLLSNKTILKFSLAKMKPQFPIIRQVVTLGTSGFVMKATTGLVQIVYNIQLLKYGGDLFIGAATVVNSIRDIAFMTFHGLVNGCQPVIGYNYGAGKNMRVREGIKFITLASFGYAAFCWAMILTFPETIARMMTSNDELIKICIPALRIFFCGFLFKAFQMVGQNVFVALGKSKNAIFFSLLKKVILVVPLLLILPKIARVGVFGVFWTEPISDLISGVACYTTLYLTVYRKLGS